MTSKESKPIETVKELKSEYNKIEKMIDKLEGNEDDTFEVKQAIITLMKRQHNFEVLELRKIRPDPIAIIEEMEKGTEDPDSLSPAWGSALSELKRRLTEKN